MASPVPATVFSYSTPGNYGPVIAIGNTRVGADSSLSSLFLFVVVDLSDLTVAAKAVSTSNSEVPSEVQPYTNSPDHALIFTTLGQITGNVPQGDLATFLQDAGSDRILAGIEQAVAQLGTGTNSLYTYALVATMDDGDLPGIEAGSVTGDLASAITFLFEPVEVGGQTRYTPVSL